MALPVAGLVSIGASLFGHHNSYPNGNPANLTKFDELGQNPTAREFGTRTNLEWLQLIANGTPFQGGPGTPFPQNPNDRLVWSDSGDAGIRSELAYVRRIVAGLTGTVQSQPTPGQVPVNVPLGSGTDLITQLQQIAARGDSATEAELYSRIAAGAGAASVKATGREQQASLIPNVTPQQIVIGLVALLALFFIIKKRG